MAAEAKLSIGDLAAAVVAQDEQIRNQLKGLVNDVVLHMRHTMRHGDPAQKTALAKQVLPQLLTAIKKVDGDTSAAEERAAYDRMMAAIRGEVEVAPVVDTTPQATADGPRPAKVAANG